MRKFLIVLLLVCPWVGAQAAAKDSMPDAQNGDELNINSTRWLGAFKLDKKQLQAIKQAVEEALHAPIDEHEVCGDPPLGCFVRTAMKWTDNGVRYREVIVYVHSKGNYYSKDNGGWTVHTVDGKWPKVVVK
ncbi:MAG TPA: hypothetical protein VKA04_05380 [Pseudodesulfovibrio sp.]|nr:hypothetical protein [Pseudodesulfovibrio sp.]